MIFIASFFFNDTATTEIYTLSLHDALPIQVPVRTTSPYVNTIGVDEEVPYPGDRNLDRKSTRLNSSHVEISYAVFCLKKKKHICPLTLVVMMESLFEP